MCVLTQRYFKIIGILMSSVGVWPYQSETSRCCAFIVYFLIGGSQLYFKVAFVGLVWPGPRVIVQCMTPIIVELTSIIQVLNLFLNRKKVKKMIDDAINWSSNSGEALIMQTYIRGAKIFALIWACSVYTTVILWNALPLLPHIFGTTGNNTRELPVPVYYHTDIEEYYYPVYAHQIVAGFIFTTGIIAADTIYVFLVQRACGLFAVLGYRLENALRENDDESSDNCPKKSDDATYECLSDCVEQHVRAIQFAKLIESAWKYSFLLTVVLEMLVVSCTGTQMVRNLTEMHLLLRQSAMIATLMSHLFIANYYAQQLMDHSLMVYDKILESNWYGTSLRTKKLLIFVTARSLKPSVLTVGGMHVMSMQTLCLVLRTSASYFMVLLSLR